MLLCILLLNSEKSSLFLHFFNEITVSTSAWRLLIVCSQFLTRLFCKFMFFFNGFWFCVKNGKISFSFIKCLRFFRRYIFCAPYFLLGVPKDTLLLGFQGFHKLFGVKNYPRYNFDTLLLAVEKSYLHLFGNFILHFADLSHFYIPIFQILFPWKRPFI